MISHAALKTNSTFFVSVAHVYVMRINCAILVLLRFTLNNVHYLLKNSKETKKKLGGQIPEYDRIDYTFRK